MKSKLKRQKETALSKSEGETEVYFGSRAPKSKASPSDVPGVKLNVKTQDVVAAVREGRERSRR